VKWALGTLGLARQPATACKAAVCMEFFFSPNTPRDCTSIYIFKRKECLIHTIISQTDLCQGKREKIKTKTEKKEETTTTAKHNSK
jgi:hypothetical protein